MDGAIMRISFFSCICDLGFGPGRSLPIFTDYVTTHSHTATRPAGQFPFTSYARFLFFYAFATPKLPNSRWRAQTASILWAPLAKKNNELSRDVTENSPAAME
jgi:hypothetical protein